MLMQTDPKETNVDPKPATNNPDEVMDKPKDVEQSDDEKIDEDFPGYPHYPSKDDILNPGNDRERVDLDVENLTRSNTISPEHIKQITGTPETQEDYTVAKEEEDDDIGMVAGNEADVTAEDLMILGSKDQDMDMDEDEELRARGWEPVTGRDLDVPDAELDGDEAPGEEDEENSYYSLGGDEMQSLRESDDQNKF